MTQLLSLPEDCVIVDESDIMESVTDSLVICVGGMEPEQEEESWTLVIGRAAWKSSSHSENSLED